MTVPIWGPRRVSVGAVGRTAGGEGLGSGTRDPGWKRAGDQVGQRGDLVGQGGQSGGRGCRRSPECAHLAGNLGECGYQLGI